MIPNKNIIIEKTIATGGTEETKFGTFPEDIKEILTILVEIGKKTRRF